MSSDFCKNLNAPYIAATVKVADPSGKLIQTSFEMSIPEFMVCYMIYNFAISFLHFAFYTVPEEETFISKTLAFSNVIDT